MVVGGTGRARSGDFARPESRRGTWLADKVESETMDEVGARVLSRSCESRVTEDETEVVCEYRALTGESVFRTRRFRGESKEDFEKLGDGSWKRLESLWRLFLLEVEEVGAAIMDIGE